MPYFHVRVSRTHAETYVIEAVDEGAAETAAVLADIKKLDKKVVLVHKDAGCSIDISDATKSDIAAALKKKRVK
ncbi:hypothetical protein EBZ80_24220 [bacterium]|nr:hypothetical protein [Betaproteobacteria bacterium]NDE18029.1 hypothetical protein [bacterium]